jgi:hypothetical protein
MPVALKGSTSGQVTITAPAVAGSGTLTAPAVTGNLITSADSGTVTQTMLASNVAGNGPACMAYTASGTQAISASTFTKIALSSELFGLSNSGYNTSTQRFVPQTAGYYYFNGNIYLSGTAVTHQAYIYKNGSYALTGPYFSTVGNAVSGLLYANGTTDYFELYIYAASSMTVSQGSFNTYMQAALIRSA